tara:strand:- start:782 stop:3523 length:2742 start_codon:yes stop_codon:yes gene_type:complete
MNAIKKIFNKNLGLIISSLIILTALMVIYSDTLDGSKSFYGANDKVSARNVKEAISKSDEYPYWFPWMMGGVPSVHSAQNISDYYPPNYIMKALHSIGVPWFWNYIFHFLFAGIGMYLLCSRLKLNRFASTLSALGFTITPYMTGMLVHGHGSQVMTLCYMPWVFYAYMMLKDKPSIKKLALLSLFLALQLLRGHVQMAYYTWLMLGILILIDIVYDFLIKKEKKVKWLIYTVLGLLLGFVSSLSLYIPMLSYTPLSTRSSGEGQGAGLEYVTEYSFSFGEIITFFIPSYYGFGGATYWGTMTFTAFPHYMSILMLMFAFYGVIRHRWVRFKIFSLICIVLFLTLSFGKNFIGFYTLFYDYLPFFSKLRNPAYLLIIVQFCTMILASMGISILIQDIKERNRILPIYLSCLFVVFSFLGLLSDFESSPDKRFKKDLKNQLERIEQAKQTYISQYENKMTEEIGNIDRSREDAIKYAKEIIFQRDDIDLNEKQSRLKDITQSYLLSDEQRKAKMIKEYEDVSNEIRRVFENQHILSAKNSYEIRLNKAKSLIDDFINAEFWVMSVLLIITMLLIFVGYYGLPFVSNHRHLIWPIMFFIGLGVFLDFYFVDRKITNPENPNYFFSNSAKEKYIDLYGDGPSLDLQYKAIIARENNYLDMPDAASWLLDKKSEGGIFRILDKDGGSRSNKWSRYHIEDVNGYHPADLKIFQDFRHKNGDIKENSYILDMLNVKYVIEQQIVSSRAQSLDRAYFISKIEIDSSNNKAKRFSQLYLSDSSPSDISYVTSNAPHLARRNFIVTNTDTIDSINNSNPNELIIKIKTSGPQFLAISEIFYPKGWKAAINNEEVNIYEVNDLIRGVYIDKKGSHTIRMWFDPSDLKWGRFLSYAGFLIILTLLFFGYTRKVWDYNFSKLKSK